ncbi:ubiquitin carboxyl-terminal hydrolase 35-like [Aphidius gifuensis]|uniref:ubiquitin carboxyl-terminal hydrolase 35-like n=1 Tax=Aphidius gifuensis TaxID=684658 RepID=UPI001CDB8075|nr:ubiquitin carboxyl-terminal hydrolase 35-like [Aphidius gifuensis]
MFNNCFVPETLENVKCDDENCKVKCNKTETKELTQTPLHLILLLKRFDLNKERQVYKIQDYVKLNENITVNNESYGLHSVIIHKGEDIEFGHYYTYNKDISKNEWYKYDDKKVINVKFNVIENLKSPDTPYMVLYKKKDNNNNNNLNKKNEQLKISPIKVTNKLDIHNNTVTKKTKIISNVILSKKKIANKIDLNLNNDDKSIGKCKTWINFIIKL